MKRFVVITYKDGSTINIDVPELYYQNKYNNKPQEKLHKIFLKEYNAFVNALNKTEGIIKVGKYLTFSNASVSTQNVLGVDIKELECEVLPLDNTVHVPGVHDQVYLNISGTRFEEFVNKVCETNIIDDADNLIKKLLSFFNKSNVEFTIKAGSKKPQQSTTTRKSKKSEQDVIVASVVEDGGAKIESTDDVSISK